MKFYEKEVLLSCPYARAKETRSTPRYHWLCHSRGSDEFVIVQYTLRGTGTFKFNGMVHQVPAGKAFISLVPEQAEYYFPAEAGEPWEFCWINFYGEASLRLWKALRDQFGPVPSLDSGSPAAMALSRLVWNVETRSFSDRFKASEESYSFFLSWWRQLSTPQQAYKIRGSLALHHCIEHFRDRTTIKELASQSGVSREHFSRLFRLQYGMGPAEYLRKQRLQAARELLLSTQLPLSEIALRCGFHSTRQFSNSFQKVYGKSAASLRKE